MKINTLAVVLPYITKPAIWLRSPAKRVFIFFAILCLGVETALAQQTNLSCGLTSTPLTSAAFGTLAVTTSATIGSGWTGTSNVTNLSTTDNATASVLVSGTVSLRVTDNTNTYAAGNFAGFVIGTSGISVSALGNITLRTYLGGILQETANSATLLSVSIGGSQVEVGFYTDRPYDAVEVEYASLLSVLGSFDVYYPVMRGTGSCSVAAAPICNMAAGLRFDNYRVVVDPVRTGLTGVTTSGWTGLNNLTDADTTNFAQLGIGLSASVISTATLGLKRVVGNFPAGYFAGFDLENRGLLGLGLLSNITVSAYRNDTLVGSASGANLLLGAAVLGNSARQTIGFVSTAAFDELQLTLVQPTNVDLGTTRVYGAVVREFCAGPALSCNVPVLQAESTHPVYINTTRTGFGGAACVLCRIDSLGNVLDTSARSASSVFLTAGVAATGSIAVRDALTTYPAGTYAGFQLSNPTLLDADVLAAVSVSVYRAGVLKQTFSGNALLVSLPSALTGTAVRHNVGFLADSAFDEIQLNLNQTAAVNLGTTYVYGALIERFCAGTLTCNSTNWLNAPAQSVLIDQLQTGVSGAVCAACAVNNPENAISPATTDFARLVTTLGVAASSSLAVKDAVNTFPSGTIAGFAVNDPNGLLQLNLLRTIRISTFNNGVLQESAGAGQLLNLSLLVLQVNPATGYYNLGMRATRPFDEIRIAVTPLAGLAPVLDVYGAFVDTRFVDTISAGLFCPRSPVADPDYIATPKGVSVSGSLRTNDRDPRGYALSYNVTPPVAPVHGSVTINGDGTFTYVPAAGYVGADSFAYTVCNTQSSCSLGWAYVSVADSAIAGGPGRMHVAAPDRSETRVNVPVAGNAAANDIDVDRSALTYSVAAAPVHGLLSITAGGQYQYTPDSSYVGSDSALINVCETANPSRCVASILRVMVYPLRSDINQAPFAADDVTVIRRGQAAAGNVLTNDSDPDGDPITAAAIGNVPASSGSFSMTNAGTWTFVPAAGFTGTVNIPYVTADNQGNFDTATLSIAVVPYLGPDYTPTISINGLNFTTAGQLRDFRVDLSELRNSGNDGQLIVRIVKPSAFDIIYSDTITVVSVGGSSTVTNANWTFSENSGFVICTLKQNVALAGFSIQSLGFRAQRKAGIPANTSQNITASIGNNTGGDGNSANNQYTTTLTAQ